MTGLAQYTVDGGGLLPRGIDENCASGDRAVFNDWMRRQGGYATVPLFFRILAERPEALNWALRVPECGLADNRISHPAPDQPTGRRAGWEIGAPVWSALELDSVQRRDVQIATVAFNRANPRNLAIVTILRRAADPAAPMRPDWAAWPTIPRPSSGPALPWPPPQDSAPANDLLRLDTTAQTEPGDLTSTLWRILERWTAALAQSPAAWNRFGTMAPSLDKQARSARQPGRVWWPCRDGRITRPIPRSRSLSQASQMPFWRS